MMMLKRLDRDTRSFHLNDTTRQRGYDLNARHCVIKSFLIFHPIRTRAIFIHANPLLNVTVYIQLKSIIAEAKQRAAFYCGVYSTLYIVYRRDQTTGRKMATSVFGPRHRWHLGDKENWEGTKKNGNKRSGIKHWRMAVRSEMMYIIIMK